MNTDYDQKQASIVPPPHQPQNSTYLTVGDEEHLYDPQHPTVSRPASPLCPATPRRGSQESSAGESDYGQEIEPFMTVSTASKVFNVLYTKSYINMRLVDPSTGQAMYYVDNSSFTRGKPDVTLCRGTEKTDPIVGVARWSHMYSKHLTIGVGNPTADEKGMIWEEVRSESSRHPDFKWSITADSGTRHEFMWERMSKDEAYLEGGEGTNTLSSKNFKLVDCATQAQVGNGEVLAVFASNRLKSWSKLGKIIIKVDGVAKGWTEKWEIMVLLSVLGLVEMSRRRSRQRRSGGAHGGP